MRKSLGLAGLVVSSIILAGCEDWGDWGESNRFKEDFHYSHDLQPGGRLSLENLNGSVEVVGSDQDKVDISGTKYASTEETMKAIKIDVVSAPDSVRIRTIIPSGHRGGMGARYVIRVPRKVEIERIVSSNGKIQIADVASAARLKTSNGSVNVSRTRGNLEVETSNASVELNSHDGSAIVHTSNGSVRADQVRGYFEATTTNSSISARLTDPEPGKPLKLESSNGSITIELAAVKNNDIRASTTNSSITVKLPASIGAQLKARTSNSSITNEFEINVRGAISKHSLEGTIGGGGPIIDLNTSNGAIRLQKL